VLPHSPWWVRQTTNVLSSVDTRPCHPESHGSKTRILRAAILQHFALLKLRAPENLCVCVCVCVNIDYVRDQNKFVRCRNKDIITGHKLLEYSIVHLFKKGK
jgi:hypothetical protein